MLFVVWHVVRKKDITIPNIIASLMPSEIHGKFFNIRWKYATSKQAKKMNEPISVQPVWGTNRNRLYVLLDSILLLFSN
jgi:hypothetical protein